MRWPNEITPIRIRSGCYDNTGKNIFTVTYAEAYAVSSAVSYYRLITSPYSSFSSIRNKVQLYSNNYL